MTKPSAEESPYTMRRVQEMLGLSRTVIQGLIAAGFVSPTRGARNERRFNFRDLMLLRTAYGLQKAKIPPRKILRSLRNLKATLPDAMPLTGIRITAVGADVAVHDPKGSWDADSGQLLMDFEVAAGEGMVAFLDHRVEHLAPEESPELFAQAEALEGTDPAAAEAFYRSALSVSPDYVNAYVNLGALLCERKRCQEAVDLYADALGRCPPSALLLFNQAVALEDLDRLDDAMRSYEGCLELDPALADAHYNLGRLHEHLGNGRSALRHFSTYRRLNL